MARHDGSIGLSRRTVLRRGAIATGVATLGVGGLSGSALASDCPRTPGFWANHDWCAVDTNPDDDEPVPGDSVAASIGIYGGEGDCPDQGSEYCLVGVCKTMSEWQAFLVQNTNGDKGAIMAKTLLATSLNFQRRPSSDPDCVDNSTDFSEFGLEETTTIRDVKRRAEDWLQASAFPDGQKQKQWTVKGMDGEPLKNVLDAFNNGNIDGLDCDCTGDE